MTRELLSNATRRRRTGVLQAGMGSATFLAGDQDSPLEKFDPGGMSCRRGGKGAGLTARDRVRSNILGDDGLTPRLTAAPCTKPSMLRPKEALTRPKTHASYNSC